MNMISRFHHFLLSCNRMIEKIKVFCRTHKMGIFLFLLCISFVLWLSLRTIQNSSSSDDNNLQLIIMSITALIALLTLDSMRRSGEVQIIREFDQQYASKEILQALDEIRSFMKKHKKNFANPRTPDKPPIINEGDYLLKKCIKNEINNERRLIKFYFLNILSMYQQGYISYPSMYHLFDKSGFVTLFEGIERMENIINKTYNTEPFEKAMTLCFDLYEKYSIINKGLEK